MNLRLESVIVKDLFSLQWVSEDGMIDNMENMVEEYKDSRQLLVSVQLLNGGSRLKVTWYV